MYVNKQPRRVKNIQLLKNSRFHLFGVITTFQNSPTVYKACGPSWYTPLKSKKERGALFSAPLMGYFFANDLIQF